MKAKEGDLHTTWTNLQPNDKSQNVLCPHTAVCRPCAPVSVCLLTNI